MNCAIYCRLSKEDVEKQLESESIQNQKALLLDYAAHQNWKVAGVYCDEDYSGADRERPAFLRLIHDAEQGVFQVILVKTQSRFTRDMELVERYIHSLFPLWGIRFIAVVDHVDTGIKGGKKARQINGLVNEWYLEDLSENIRAVLDYKRKNGQFIGSFAPYGYRKDPQNHNQLIPDPETAPVVQKIFSLCQNGMGKTRIAQQLNELGIPSPADQQNRFGADNPEHTPWNRTAVGRILRSETYIGTLVQGVRKKISYKGGACRTLPCENWIRVPNSHQPIVDPNTFQKVQLLLNQKTRSDGRGVVHPLSGLTYCAACGGGMVRSSSNYRGRRTDYLSCGRYRSDHTLCTRHSIRLEELTTLVQEKIGQKLSEAFPTLPAGLSLTESRLTQAAEEHKDTVQLEHRQLQLNRALRQLYLDYGAGLFHQDRFTSLRDDFLKQQAAVSAQLQKQKANSQKDDPPCQKGTVQQLQDWFKNPTLTRELAVLLLRRIEIGEKEEESGTQIITIYWAF